MAARALACVLALLALTGPAAAATRTAVTVKFVLQAFRPEHFNDAESEQVQKLAGELLAAKLRERVPFLDFTTQAGPSFAFVATLRSRLAAEHAGAPGEVILEFRLDGAGAPRPEFVVFRPANSITGIPGVDGLVKEIDTRLGGEQYLRLRALLLRVPVATTGNVVSSPTPGWALPYLRNELCLPFESQLDVHHVITTPQGVLRPRLPARAEADDSEGRIVGVPTSATEFQQKIATLPQNQITVGPIWVTVYEDPGDCSRDFVR
jgi:hypothetical protein